MGYPPPAGVPHPQHTVVLEPPPTGVPHPAPTELQTYGGHFSYQYSKCNGRHKALLVGINYFGQNGELKESINRARDVRAFILRECGYNEVNIVQLYDNSTDPKVKPTKANIMANIKELVAGAQPNDSLFFFYAGHGGQTRDTNGDEDTGYDEVIYPGDHETSGPILDDELWEALVKPLPSGCRLTALFDSPHTESPLDLPFIYTAEGKIKEPNLTRQNRTSSADVICFSGPKLLQPGSDTLVAGGQSGTLSYELAVALSRKWGKTNQQLLVGLRESLKGQYSEVQLSSSHPLHRVQYLN
ncbi:hypothetical protein BDN72DRAFT_264865 [Pluteus cervinus]|uniref:Uncharacterized protein n=1 Tax=Pluteus cervinus TaxID=181527 RepID=A0ACD3AFB7_9AGAR|nr:hypothetical protein BDN72DRAFT_264865 [Pluteus cervinus]